MSDISWLWLAIAFQGFLIVRLSIICNKDSDLIWKEIAEALDRDVKGMDLILGLGRWMERIEKSK
jgi:hypothetical protein